MVLSWNIVFSPSMLLDSFTGYINMCWHLWLLRVFRPSFQNFLLLVFIEKSGVILIDSPLHITWSFFFVSFNILSLFYIFIILCQRKFIFCPSTFAVLYVSCTLIGISFFRLEGFSSMIMLKMFSVTLTWISSPSSIPIILRFDLFSVSDILGVLYQDILDLTFYWPMYPFILLYLHCMRFCLLIFCIF